VFAIAVNGVVLGVKVVVYTAVPLTMRTLLIYPLTANAPTELPPGALPVAPIPNWSVVLKLTELVAVPRDTPSRYNVTVVPLRTNA